MGGLFSTIIEMILILKCISSKLHFDEICFNTICSQNTAVWLYLFKDLPKFLCANCTRKCVNLKTNLMVSLFLHLTHFIVIWQFTNNICKIHEFIYNTSPPPQWPTTLPLLTQKLKCLIRHFFVAFCWHFAGLDPR